MATKSAKVEQYERVAAFTAELTDVLCKDVQGKRHLFPPQIAQGVVELLRLADRLHRYFEVDCNYGLTTKQAASVAHIERRITAICQAWGLSVRFNGDPRGYAVRIALPSGSYNTWGGKEEGWGI